MSICMIPRDILIMEKDNLKLYKRTGNIYGNDGNLISASTISECFWQSKTTREENYAVLKDNVHLVIYDKNGQFIWSS